METALIIIIVGLAAAYLVRRVFRSIRKTGESQCGCGCTSCPGEKTCEISSPKVFQHINPLEKK